MSGARETARDAAREAVARAMWERRRINCARHDIILLPWENENAEQRANVLAEADAAIDAFTRSTGAPAYADGIEAAAKVCEAYGSDIDPQTGDYLASRIRELAADRTKP